MNRQSFPSRRLYESAQAQGGLFTTRQARAAGFKDNVHPYHVRAGNWVRERRGIYRLAQFPASARPDLMLWQLWSQNRAGEPQGTFSHATALTLHELSDVMPRRLDLTVPPGFQRMVATPRVLQLHRALLGAGDVETINGRPVSDPEFRASVRNPPDQPPAMNVEDCAEIEKDSSLQDSPFIYTPE